MLNVLWSRECFVIKEEGGVKDFASLDYHVACLHTAATLTVLILFIIDIIMYPLLFNLR